MGRRPIHQPLRVYLNARLVGYLTKEPSGAVSFRYDQDWLDLKNALPISLSLPLREDAYSGEAVMAVFENLLPDSPVLLKRVAEKVGARGVDAYSMLAKIGQDCVGALQFISGDNERDETVGIKGEEVDDDAIEKILNNLARAPLGLDRDDDFRISVAGAQEKTALLRHNGRWIKPHGTTPTTHIFKTQIGTLPDGLDLSNSVENEFYCLKLAEAFGFSTNAVEIVTFGKTKTLAIERFDRRWLAQDKLLRLPQEDCCQALSVPPTLKYQNEGGPGIVKILKLLKASDTPMEDQESFLAAQIFFWLIGATDGHAKNFSVFLTAGGRFKLTPLYDILSAQPSLDALEINRKQMKLAMSVGKNRHYRMDQIQPRHFVQSAEAAGVAKSIAVRALQRIAERGADAFEKVLRELPADFPEDLHVSIQAVGLHRLEIIKRALGDL
ncbi:type II toxin-antitoxin system HipA family toxin [Ahrensia sp. 13_GOM-1096m]|uniref:type II toxin-antitoxin system HipA family toxin n=1 Tax=Ahrensia sp. 13_GOM-1096m TaxID=1380380 RepID=UPI00047930F2|nr:type II toxin-antitoxin system HipA family toxin [Ahrensia sp. 13_GOM-1096m]